jgi:hypothetical protein
MTSRAAAISSAARPLLGVGRRSAEEVTTVTRDRGFKRLVRARMGRTGESYTSARALLRSRRDHAGQPPALVTMSGRELAALPDAELVARCAGPAQRSLRSSDPAARAAAIRDLTRGQQVLLGYWLLAAHAGRGLSGFCEEMPHRAVHDGYWTLVEVGLRELGADELLALVGRLRAEVARALAESGFPEGLGSDGQLDRDGFRRVVAALALLDPRVMAELDEGYRRIEADTLGRVARYVRERPADFVTLTDVPSGDAR